MQIVIHKIKIMLILIMIIRQRIIKIFLMNILFQKKKYENKNLNIDYNKSIESIISESFKLIDNQN